MISFIVSSKGRPSSLEMCLAALTLQNCPKEILVAGTWDDGPFLGAIKTACEYFGVRYIGTDKEYIYEASNEAAKQANGYWLSFPNDDAYLVPGYGSVMVGTARENGWRFVTCDIVYDPRMGGTYNVFHPRLKIAEIDKIQFAIERQLWDELGGFPAIENRQVIDGAFVELVKKSGAPWGKAPGILGVHN